VKERGDGTVRTKSESSNRRVLEKGVVTVEPSSLLPLTRRKKVYCWEEGGKGGRLVRDRD